MKTGAKLGVLGLVVSLGCAMTWFYQAHQVAIPEDRTAFVAVFLTGAALGVAAFVKGAGWLGGVAAAGAIVVGLFLPFTVAISRQEVATTGIQVGDSIPHFAAVDDQGQLFDSKSLRGKPVLMKFFRAHW